MYEASQRSLFYYINVYLTHLSGYICNEEFACEMAKITQ